ncbi:MAG: ComF family protein [Treponemataceae bacterium]
MKFKGFSPVYLRNRFRDIYAKILAAQVCVICESETYSAISICKACEEKFFKSCLDLHFYETEKFCKVCGKALISEIAVCQRCKKNFIHKEIPQPKYSDEDKRIQEKTKVFFERNFALFPYIGTGQKIVSSWKNTGVRNYAEIFSKYILQFLKSQNELASLSIVPVPPRPTKLKTKGWDQIADLASELQASGKKVLNLLKRYDGVSQKHASKLERAKNLQGKFYTSKNAKNKMPETVILLDDIITTGATINECSKVLIEAGCKKIYSLCLFFD